MKLYLVRHGHTEGNKVHLYQDRHDRLSAEGERQSDILAQRFQAITVDAIIASPSSRAQETAGKIATQKGMIMEINDLLDEKYWGSTLTGKQASDPTITKLRRLIHEKEQSEPEWRHGDEERFIDVRKRAVNFLHYAATTLAQQHKNVLVVSHAHYLKILLSVVIHGPEVPAKIFRELYHTVSMHNTGITVIQLIEQGWNIATLNDHAHLGEYHAQSDMITRVV